MQEFMETTWKMITDSNILSLLSALLALVAGWLIATIASRLTSKGLQKIGLGRSLAVCLPEEEAEKAVRIEKFISGIVYYLILLIAVLACLTALNLTEAADPIREFVNKVTGYIPHVLAALVLLFLAWVLATALRYVSLTAVKAFKLDEKVNQYVDTDGKESQLGSTIANVVYWLTFLFFAPAILRALEITGITEPLETMIGKILRFMPNLVTAAGIAFVGLFLANLVRKVVTSTLTALNIDALGEKAGVHKLFDQKSLSKLTGFIAYVLIAVPVVIAALDVLRIEKLSDSLKSLLDNILYAASNILGAGLLLFAAYIVGCFIAGLVIQLLENFGFNKLMTAVGCPGNEEKGLSPAKVVGKLTLIAILFLAAIAACELLHFEKLASLLRDFIPFAGNLLVGVIVFIIGIFLANLAADTIKSKGFESRVFTLMIKVIVLVFAGAVALHRMEIGGEIVKIAFAIVFGTAGIAAAAAFALAFGLGGRDFAAKKLEEWDQKFSKKD